MIINLFSVFDPTSYFGLSLNWLIIIIIFIFIPCKYYFVERGCFIIFKIIFVKIRGVFSEVSRPNHIALNFISVITFIYLIFRNILGLFPFIFTRTAHPIITIGLGLVMWLSFFVIGWFKNFKNSLAHLVPEGSPIVLSPLIVLIESIRHLIRPFTLSVRLAANIMAGHLIVGLLSSIRLLNLYGFIRSLFLQNILLILEFGVAVIQGFVFRILLLLYALDYY